MKSISSNTKLILLQPSLHKQSSASIAAFGSSHRLLLIAFISFFTFASLLIALFTTTTPSGGGGAGGVSHPAMRTSSSKPSLPHHVFDALLHYATPSNFFDTMSAPDLHSIAAVLRRRGP